MQSVFSKCNDWLCFNPEPEEPKGEHGEGAERKWCLSCTTEVVLPVTLKQEPRCVLDREVNICGALVFSMVKT